MATGNIYALPQAALDCLGAGGTPAACMAVDNHFDSIIALDNAVKWEVVACRTTPGTSPAD